jgi:hypothetical protein
MKDGEKVHLVTQSDSTPYMIGSCQDPTNDATNFTLPSVIRKKLGWVAQPQCFQPFSHGSGIIASQTVQPDLVHQRAGIGFEVSHAG